MQPAHCLDGAEAVHMTDQIDEVAAFIGAVVFPALLAVALVDAQGGIAIGLMRTVVIASTASPIQTQPSGEVMQVNAQAQLLDACYRSINVRASKAI